MKKKILLSILFIVAFSFVSLSQTLVKEGKRWKILAREISRPRLCYIEDFFIRGDSLIEGIYYKVLYRQSENNPNPLLFGFLREENNQIYCRAVIFPSGIATDDRLLYNFDVKEGDSVAFDNYFFGEGVRYLTLQKIESENINGSQVKKWSFIGERGRADVWYENIGSKWGVIYMGSGAVLYYSFLISCTDSDGTVLYYDKNVTPCEDYYPSAVSE